MPTTRRSTGGPKARTGPTKGQSTLSFSNRVTKGVPKDHKKDIISAPAVAKVEPPAAEDEVKDVVLDEPEAEEQEEEVAGEEKVEEKSDAEIQAEKVTDAQIEKYWKGIEKQRMAPRVHQQDLMISERVLRYFDVSSQYGPCIGVPRIKRWQRADRLGLSPPVEVLAVLMKEENRGNSRIETAHMDQILNSTAIGS